MTVQAASDWRSQGLYPFAYPYREAAFSISDRMSEHPAAVQWRALLADGFSYDAPIACALCHSALPEFRQIAPFDPTYVVQRAGPEGMSRLRAFASALRDFAREADFQNFLAVWRSFHATLVSEARSSVDPAWSARLARYSGMPPSGVRVCLAPLSSQCGYGPTIAYPDGPVQVTVTGPLRVDDDGQPHFDDVAFWKAIILHEGAHGFVNPTFDAQAAGLEASAALFESVAAAFAGSPYGTWRIFVIENIVRAVVARLSEDCEAVLAQEEKRGFRYIRAVAASLEAYESSRDRYPTFADFGPRLVEVFAELARRL